jgi:hypothetical protein
VPPSYAWFRQSASVPGAYRRVSIDTVVDPS